MEEKTINQMDPRQSLLPARCSLPSSPPLLAGSTALCKPKAPAWLQPRTHYRYHRAGPPAWATALQTMLMLEQGCVGCNKRHTAGLVLYGSLGVCQAGPTVQAGDGRFSFQDSLHAGLMSCRVADMLGCMVLQ